MCRDCGCSAKDGNPALSDKKTVEVLTKILDSNDRRALSNRKHFEEHGVLAINLMSSPGAGKTTLLERTIEELRGELKIGVIEGDLETNRDAERIRSKGAPAYQISTGQACHLDAFMVHEGIHNLPLDELDVVFIENVGNLVCPAAYDVGAHINMVLLSTTEGEDKPQKYPVMFKSADLMLISKIDLLPYMDFDVEEAVKFAKSINPRLEWIPLSAKTGSGLKDWFNFIKSSKVRLCLQESL
ncbi:MAG TPA: hydrogenase nickel incorporation protein HypB [Aigarchaeota archaeon]|nr:hydrogenase nickel incorporation protein HypB [Aigarchaeota archaeon]